MRDKSALQRSFVMAGGLALAAWIGVAAVAARAAETPQAVPTPETSRTAPAPAAPDLTPAPLFKTDYLCTCEVEDPCTHSFILGGRFCPVGDTCTCHPQTSGGCVTGIASIDCNDNSM